MDKRILIGGLALIVLVVVLVSLQAPVEESEAPAAVGDGTFANCVDDALLEAERCLLAGEADCKTKTERALDACK